MKKSIKKPTPPSFQKHPKKTKQIKKPHPNPTPTPTCHNPHKNQFNSPGILACSNDLLPLISVGSRKKFYIASIAKLFVLCTFWEIKDQLGFRLGELVEVPDIPLPRNQTRIGIRPGERVTLEDLIFAMAIHSGNDASHALAIIAGNKLKPKKDKTPPEQTFLKKIHQFCTKHQLSHTSVLGVRGIENSYSSAHDIAIILKLIYQNQQLYNYFKVYQKVISIYDVEGRMRKFCLAPTNLLMQSYFYGKTGSHPELSFCFASVKEYRGKPIFMVALGCPSFTGRFTDTQMLYRKASKMLRQKQESIATTTTSLNIEKEKVVELPRVRTRSKKQ